MTKKALYESIMKDVAKIVKSHLNEGDMHLPGSLLAIIDKIEDCGCLTNDELRKLSNVVLDYEAKQDRKKYDLPEAPRGDLKLPRSKRELEFDDIEIEDERNSNRRYVPFFNTNDE